MEGYCYTNFILLDLEQTDHLQRFLRNITNGGRGGGKGKQAIPVPGCGGLYGCETIMIPHCLDNWFTDGGEIVSLCTGLAPLPRNIFISVSGIHFCLRPSKPQGLLRVEGLGIMIKKSFTY
jgi:hypothetical protein